MAFKKNISGNPKGKPKGAVNKNTIQIKDAIQQIISNNIDKLNNDFDTLEPKDRLLMFEKLLKFVLPPAKELETINNNTNNQIRVVWDAEPPKPKYTADEVCRIARELRGE